jgi:anthranilate phosphoribosyltransferase
MMNGLSTISSWGGEQKPLLEYVYGAIDSKIDFVELNTRKLLAKFSRKETTQVQGTHQTDAVLVQPSSADANVNNNENDTFFTEIEELSRTMTMLENMKFSLREHNLASVMELLDDNKFMRYDDSSLNQALDIHEGKM